MPQKISEVLTQSYREQNLPDGWYYIQCADLEVQIGYYRQPTLAERVDRQQKGLQQPEPRLFTNMGLLKGSLRTVRILAPVPPYNPEQAKENQNAIKS